MNIYFTKERYRYDQFALYFDHEISLSYYRESTVIPSILHVNRESRQVGLGPRMYVYVDVTKPITN